eukprot:149573-Chlamydomonas_euryale.AAC.1
MVFELGVSWVKSRGLWLEVGHVVNLRYAHLRCEPTALHPLPSKPEHPRPARPQPTQPKRPPHEAPPAAAADH